MARQASDSRHATVVHRQLRVTLLAHAISDWGRMGLELVAFRAFELWLINHMREVTARNSNILLGLRIQVATATTREVGFAMSGRFGIATEPPADLQAHAPSKFRAMTVLARQVLMCMLAYGLESVAVARNTIGRFTCYVFMRLVTPS